jgi:hypothetical protein
VFKIPANLIHIIRTGTTERRRVDALPRKEEMFWRIQMPDVQTKVDEREQLGQHGTNVREMPHQRVSTQATTAGQTGRVGRLGSSEGTPTAPVREM